MSSITEAVSLCMTRHQWPLSTSFQAMVPWMHLIYCQYHTVITHCTSGLVATCCQSNGQSASGRPHRCRTQLAETMRHYAVGEARRGRPCQCMIDHHERLPLAVDLCAVTRGHASPQHRHSFALVNCGISFVVTAVTRVQEAVSHLHR